MKIIYRIIGIILLVYLSPNLLGVDKSDLSPDSFALDKSNEKVPLSEAERGQLEKENSPALLGITLPTN